MSRAIAVLRPEPGNAATVARIRQAGLIAISLPLFAIRALDWSAPDAPKGYDGLLLTSANTVRFGGGGLGGVMHLPTFAVGDATATAARQAGFDVVATGDSDAAALTELARLRGFGRLLHLGGRDRADGQGTNVTTATAVYASEDCPIRAADIRPLSGTVALLHSPRAARRWGTLCNDAGLGRGDIAIAALSESVAEAAGAGWRALAVARAPRDDALIDAARTLID